MAAETDSVAATRALGWKKRRSRSEALPFRLNLPGTEQHGNSEPIPCIFLTGSGSGILERLKQPRSS
jgi:hypothetical protein